MKRFNIARYAVPIWLVLIFAIIALVKKPTSEPEVQTNVFCAYGKIFIEFEEGNHKWGTMMLNDNGKPIQCQDPVSNTPAVSFEKINNI